MRVYFDTPDDIVSGSPFPLDYKEAAGYLFVAITPGETEGLISAYTTGLDLNHPEHVRVAEYLNRIARYITKEDRFPDNGNPEFSN